MPQLNSSIGREILYDQNVGHTQLPKKTNRAWQVKGSIEAQNPYGYLLLSGAN
jgi:hypothetical protein